MGKKKKGAPSRRKQSPRPGLSGRNSENKGEYAATEKKKKRYTPPKLQSLSATPRAGGEVGRGKDAGKFRGKKNPPPRRRKGSSTMSKGGALVKKKRVLLDAPGEARDSGDPSKGKRGEMSTEKKEERGRPWSPLNALDRGKKRKKHPKPALVGQLKLIQNVFIR